MFDVDVAFRKWMIADGSPMLSLLPAERIVGGDLPQGANPGTGEKWMTFYSRGGVGHPEIGKLVSPSFAITFWAKKGAVLDARELYRTFRDMAFDVCNQAVGDAVIMAANEEVIGQDISDPATEWALCVTYYTVEMRALS